VGPNRAQRKPPGAGIEGRAKFAPEDAMSRALAPARAAHRGRFPSEPAGSASRKGTAKARAKFLRWFPGGFADETYLEWERDYKWKAHLAWEEELSRDAMRALLEEGRHAEVAARAVRIEGRTNLLFSFEKMALRDAVRPPRGAELFAEGLFDLLHGRGTSEARFDRWCETVGSLPRRQTRVLTWPVATVFGFLAQPDRHVFLKPNVTRAALAAYGLAFDYVSRPGGLAYAHLLSLAGAVRRDLADLKPRDLIDVQSFLWVLGSDEYAE
jgi:hypothetical protein